MLLAVQLLDGNFFKFKIDRATTSTPNVKKVILKYKKLFINFQRLITWRYKQHFDLVETSVMHCHDSNIILFRTKFTRTIKLNLLTHKNTGSLNEKDVVHVFISIWPVRS